jgi:hypothetical protein
LELLIVAVVFIGVIIRNLLRKRILKMMCIVEKTKLHNTLLVVNFLDTMIILHKLEMNLDYIIYILPLMVDVVLVDFSGNIIQEMILI